MEVFQVIEADAARPSHAAGVAERRPDLQYLHPVRQLDEELRIAVQVMDPFRVITGEARHGCHILPVRNRHELDFVLTLLAEGLHPERRSGIGLVGYLWALATFNRRA